MDEALKRFGYYGLYTGPARNITNLLGNYGWSLKG